MSLLVSTSNHYGLVHSENSMLDHSIEHTCVEPYLLGHSIVAFLADQKVWLATRPAGLLPDEFAQFNNFWSC